MARKDKQKDKEYNALYYRTKRPKGVQRKSHLKIAYGITPEQYDIMYENQQGCCGICGKHQSELKRRLHVDHDHTTMKVRGLLCQNCNSVLGQAFDSIQTLKNAIAYLGDE